MTTFTYNSMILRAEDDGLRVTGPGEFTIDVVPHYYDAEGTEVFPPLGFVPCGPVTVPLQPQAAEPCSEVQGD